MSMLGDALANGFMTQGLMAGMGEPATYTRGGTVLNLTVIAQGSARGEEYATRLGSTPESTDYVLFTPEIGYCGFSVQVDDLATLTPPTPSRGDVINIGGVNYPVQAPEGLEPWSWEDLPFMTLFRVHTKKN